MRGGAVVRQPVDLNIGTSDFTVAAWIRAQAKPPGRHRSARAPTSAPTVGFWKWQITVARYASRRRALPTRPTAWSHPRGGVLKPKVWQHVAAIVRRGANEAKLYVNGYAVARGTIEAGRPRQS